MFLVASLIRYTGRVSTDHLGTMEAENTVQTGSRAELPKLADGVTTVQ